MDPFQDLFDLPRRMIQQAEQEAAEALIRMASRYSAEDQATLRNMRISPE